MSAADQLSDPAASTRLSQARVLAKLLTTGHGSGDAAVVASLLQPLAEALGLAKGCPIANNEPRQPSHRRKLDSRIAKCASDLHAAGLTLLADQLRQDARAVTDTFVGVRRMATLLERLGAHSETATCLASAGLADEFQACRKLTSALLVKFDEDAALDAPSIAEAARNEGFVDPEAAAFLREFSYARLRRRARRDAALDTPSIAEAARDEGSVDPKAAAFLRECSYALLRRRAGRPSKGS